MKKNKEPTYIPMKCPVCDECYRLSDRPGDRCHFGGPFIGYSIVNDKK